MIVALGMVVFVAMVGLVVDGGFAWGKQRDTQNAADASAESGAAALAEKLAGILRNDAYVWAVVQRTGVANGVPAVGAPAVDPATECTDGQPPAAGKDGLCAYYTDATGALLLDRAWPARLPSGTLGSAMPPASASGVLAYGRQSFHTFLAAVVGIDRWSAEEPATAVAGYVSEGIGLPVTFPVVQFGCDSHEPVAVGFGRLPHQHQLSICPPAVQQRAGQHRLAGLLTTRRWNERDRRPGQ